MLPALNAGKYMGITPWLAASQTAGQLPYAGVGALSPLLGLAQGAGTTKGTVPGGWGSDLINAGASIASAAIMASDRRLKKDIVEVGIHRSGLTEYEWTYRFDPTNTRCRGVMADEVKEKRPQAYIENWNGTGYAAVNYGAL